MTLISVIGVIRVIVGMVFEIIARFSVSLIN